MLTTPSRKSVETLKALAMRMMCSALILSVFPEMKRLTALSVLPMRDASLRLSNFALFQQLLNPLPDVSGQVFACHVRHLFLVNFLRILYSNTPSLAMLCRPSFLHFCKSEGRLFSFLAVLRDFKAKGHFLRIFRQTGKNPPIFFRR